MSIGLSTEMVHSIVKTGMSVLTLFEVACKAAGALPRLRRHIPLPILAVAVVGIGFYPQFTSNGQRFVDGSPPNNYLFVGNPGVGKSTMENGMLGWVAFKSGIKFGSGLTTALNTVRQNGTLYMDTPGLDDPEIRERAAREISAALKEPGSYKVFFVVTLEAGRVRPADQVLMQLILEAAPTLLHYGVIINKMPKPVARRLKSNSTELAAVKTYLMGQLQRPTDNVLVLENLEELDGVDDALWLPPIEFCQFVEGTPLTRIGEDNVTEINTHSYMQMIEKNKEANAQIQNNEVAFHQLKEDMELRLQEQRRRYEQDKKDNERRVQDEMAKLKHSQREAINQMSEHLELSNKEKLALQEEIANLTKQQLDNVSHLMKLVHNFTKEQEISYQEKSLLEEKMRNLTRSVDEEKADLASRLEANMSSLRKRHEEEVTANEERFERQKSEIENKFEQKLATLRGDLLQAEAATEVKAKQQIGLEYTLQQYRQLLLTPRQERKGLTDILQQMQRALDLQHVQHMDKPSTLIYGGFQYRVMMEKIPIDGPLDFCHEAWVPMPVGYELAPDTNEVRQQIVATHTWSTHIVVLDTLKAYATARGAATPGDHFGDGQPKAERKTINGILGYKMGPWTCYQVLVRTKVTGDHQGPGAQERMTALESKDAARWARDMR